MSSCCDSTSIKRKALVVNPAKTCQPIGAVYAALGFEKCMPHSHGSQGCASYLRMHLTRHFREPIITTTSSFSEGQVVFGGGANLKQAIKNIIHIYKPKMIGISTTCSAETIGDDVPGLVNDMKRAGEIPEDLYVFTASTPSYQGSHVTGWANMVKGAVEAFAKKGEPNNKITIIPGMMSPGDIREIKRVLKLMEVEFIMLPDISGVLDSPMTGDLQLYSGKGTTVEEVGEAANAVATIVLGEETGLPAAKYLQEEFEVPYVVLPQPASIEAMDQFLMEVSKLTGKPIPAELEEERGRLVDMMLDAHAHWYGKSVAITGDPDVALSMANLAKSLGMKVSYVLTGTRSLAWKKAIGKIVPDAEIFNGGDYYDLELALKKAPVDMIIGTSYAKYLALDYDIPLIRVGFPIVDRANLTNFPVVGYEGIARNVERIGNTFLDYLDRKQERHLVELVM